MHHRIFRNMVCVFVATTCLAVRAEDVGLSVRRDSIWRQLSESPLEVTVAAKNLMTGECLFVGQPLLVNIGVRNALARELGGLADAESHALQEQNVDLSRASLAICRAPESWVSFIRVFVGTDPEHIAWSGSLASASNRVLHVNEVDRNPVSVADYVSDATELPAGRYHVWAVFDNASLDTATHPDVYRTSVTSEVLTVTVMLASNASQRAWVLAEKGRAAKQQKRFDEAESLFKQAKVEDSTLGRGPTINGQRVFDLNWELADIYEMTARYKDAVQAAQLTRARAEGMPPAARGQVLEQIEQTLSRLQKQEASRP